MKNHLVVLAFILIPALAKCQSSGPLHPTKIATMDLAGSSSTWKYIENAGASDDQYAVFDDLPPVTGAYTDYLAVSGFGFEIPQGAVIKGIQVEIERSDPAARTADYSVRLTYQGNLLKHEGSSQDNYPTTDAYQRFGGPTDLWGASWTEQALNDQSFGVAISAQRNADDNSTNGQIDDIQLTIFYSFSTLPVTLIDFNAIKKAESVMLNWKTAQESGMDKFIIERSSNGTFYQQLAQVNAVNQQAAQYSWQDIHPLSSIAYYRLKMVGQAGNSTYSKSVLVNMSKDINAKIYPSTWTKGDNLYVNNPTNQWLGIQFYAGDGRMLGETTTSSTTISPTFSIEKGMVYYKILGKNGQLYSCGSLFIY